jgi:hypothetical protein
MSTEWSNAQVWKGRPWRRYLEPYAVAIKTLLLQHLLDDRPHPRPQQYPIGTFVIYGVMFYSHEDLDARLQEILKGPDGSERVEGIRAARRLRARQLRLDVMMLRHPDLSRLPVMAGRSEVEPLPEDKPLNDLLLQAKTLSLTHPHTYVSLYIDSWPRSHGWWVRSLNGNQSDGETVDRNVRLR